jgi:hypothetical protein
LGKIRHWQIIEGSYENAPDIEAHWHIDPPYRNSGKHYPVNGIDYTALAAWCKQRRGYVQVCESSEANWLPFQPFAIVNTGACHGGRGFSAESIYEHDTGTVEASGPFEPARPYAHSTIKSRPALP